MKPYRVIPTSDKKLLASFFERDPALYAYQLGDLDPFFFANTNWWIIAKPAGEIQAATLLYRAFDTPVIQALTDNDAQGELWRRLLKKLPPRAHTHYRLRHKTIISEHYQIQEIGTHYKMRWDDNHSAHQSRDIDMTKVVTLSPVDRGRVRALHQRAYPDSYFDTRLLETGYCVGIYADDRLVSVAACHVLSKRYGVAALGAITTDDKYRGRGYGSAVTLALVKKLAPEIECICLNVHSGNAGAMRIYERLGFVRCHEYEEGILTAHDSGDS